MQGCVAWVGMSRWGGDVGADAGAEVAQLLVSMTQASKAGRIDRVFRIGRVLGGEGGLMGDGVGRANLDRDAVDAPDGVGRAGRLDAARGGVGVGGGGRGLRPVRALLQAVERVEAEADRAEREDQAHSADEKNDQADWRGEVERSGFHHSPPSEEIQARTSKQGQAFSHSFGVIFPSPFLSGDRSRWPRIWAVG